MSPPCLVFFRARLIRTNGVYRVVKPWKYLPSRPPYSYIIRNQNLHAYRLYRVRVREHDGVSWKSSKNFRESQRNRTRLKRLIITTHHPKTTGSGQLVGRIKNYGCKLYLHSISQLRIKRIGRLSLILTVHLKSCTFLIPAFWRMRRRESHYRARVPIYDISLRTFLTLCVSFFIFFFFT